MVNFSTNFSSLMEPTTNFNTNRLKCDRLYNFSAFILDEKQNILVQYNRKVHIIYIGKVSGFHRFQLLTLDYKFESKRNNNNALIEEIAYLFDEIIVNINEDFKINQVINLVELNIKWDQLKEKLRKEYTGQVFENYLSAVDEIIYDEVNFIRFLHEYKMFGLFFNNYFHDFPIDKLINFEHNSTLLKANYCRNNKDSIKITTFNNNINEEFYFEDSTPLDGFVYHLKQNKTYNYKMISLGLRKKT